MPDSVAEPRWSLALLSSLIAGVLAWGATTLPWQDYTAFAAVTGVLAGLHGITALLAFAGATGRLRAWRVQSWASLAWLGWLGWKLTTGALYIGRVYGGLGEGIGVVLLACIGLCALVVLPVAIWGIVATGGLCWRKGEAGAATLAGILIVGGLGLSWGKGGAQAAPAGIDAQALGVLAPPPGASAPSLFRTGPTTCDRSPGVDVATAVVTLAVPEEAVGSRILSRCVQAGTGKDLVPLLVDATADAMAGSRIKLDVITAVQDLPALTGSLAALALRPGLDGACREGVCLMPWQLVAADRFNTYRPFSAVQDIRFGLAPGLLQEVLGGPAKASGLEGLRRIETDSFVIEPGGVVTPLRRMHGPRPAVTAESLAQAIAAAQDQVIAATLESGRFRYLLDPMRGKTPGGRFSLPRQGGTTYSLCDVGEDSAEVSEVAARSLAMMAALERPLGEGVGALQYPSGGGSRRIGFRQSTIPLIAFLSCRSRVGPVHDDLIGRLGRFMLAMQRPDGGYYPLWDAKGQQPIPGAELVYSGGQATLALVMMEALQREEALPGLPPLAEIEAAVERSMAWYGGPYWDHGAAEFVYLEENWHCLAARTALPFHRNDDYERFCLDYVSMKGRLVLGPDDGVDGDLVGGYGWGNVFLPHNTGTAGYLEALAASMALKEARGESLDRDRERLRLSLGFMLQNQWTPTTCFACAPDPVVPGSWSEHMASPEIRIDYIQHAWSGLAHSARMLALD